METLNEKYGLPKRIKLEVLNEQTIGIVKIIKSRIIQKDTKKILEIADTIRAVDGNKKISLICTENICSKSKKLLDENNVDIIIRKL